MRIARPSTLALWVPRKGARAPNPKFTNVAQSAYATKKMPMIRHGNMCSAPLTSREFAGVIHPPNLVERVYAEHRKRHHPYKPKYRAWLLARRRSEIYGRVSPFAPW